MDFFRATDDDAKRFAETGYLIVRGLLTSEESESLQRLAKGDHQLAQEAYAKTDASGRQSKLAVRNELSGSPYRSVIGSQRIVETMERLLGDEVYHYHHKMMLKEPRVGGAWEWHQDYGYWYNNGCLYPDMGSCLIAIDRATPANGCLQVIPGSHHFGRVDHVVEGNQTMADPARVSAALERLERVHVELDPGDAVIFHGNLLHRSDPNLSDDPRWSLICCYNTRHNDPFIQNGRHPNYHPLDTVPDDQVVSQLQGMIEAHGG